MLYAAIDIHKHVFQAAVLDSESGEVIEERFSADRESLGRWAGEWQGRVAAVAIEATTGWRWVWRELVSHGFDVRLAEPVQARGLLGRRRSAKTDRFCSRSSSISSCCAGDEEGDHAARTPDAGRASGLLLRVTTEAAITPSRPRPGRCCARRGAAP